MNTIIARATPDPRSLWATTTTNNEINVKKIIGSSVLLTLFRLPLCLAFIRNDATKTIKPNFKNSTGCNDIGPSGIQRQAPLIQKLASINPKIGGIILRMNVTIKIANDNLNNILKFTNFATRKKIPNPTIRNIDCLRTEYSAGKAGDIEMAKINPNNDKAITMAIMILAGRCFRPMTISVPGLLIFFQISEKKLFILPAKPVSELFVFLYVCFKLGYMIFL